MTFGTINKYIKSKSVNLTSFSDLSMAVNIPEKSITDFLPVKILIDIGIRNDKT